MNSSTPINLRTSVEALGLIAVVASLLFLAMEIRQSRQIGRSEASFGVVETVQQIRESILANTDVWIRGCRGDDLDDVERAQFAQLFRGYTQRTYFIWLASQDSILGLDGATPANLYAANYHRYPGFAAMAHLQSKWLNDERGQSEGDVQRFSDAVSSRIAALREIEPNPDFDAAFCGL
jgi:hypothetical protein